MILFQIVTYTADDSGYHAKVEYQGEAHHDHPQHHQYSPHPHDATHIPHGQPETLHESPDKIYKYSPTPYPAGPTVFRPKAPLYNTKPTYHKIHQPNHDTQNRHPPSPPAYNSIPPLHYKGKLVFLDKKGPAAPLPPLLPSIQIGP